MSITDKLREAFNECTVMAGVENDFECVYITKAAAMLCLDEIDAEHEKELAEQYASLTVDMEPMTDKNMAKHGWARLPKDAGTSKVKRHGSLADNPSMVCWSCSECGFGWHHSIYDKPFVYCPNCRRVLVYECD